MGGFTLLRRIAPTPATSIKTMRRQHRGGRRYQNGVQTQSQSKKPLHFCRGASRGLSLP